MAERSLPASFTRCADGMAELLNWRMISHATPAAAATPVVGDSAQMQPTVKLRRARSRLLLRGPTLC
jgi:hypothetical protein